MRIGWEHHTSYLPSMYYVQYVNVVIVQLLLLLLLVVDVVAIATVFVSFCHLNNFLQRKASKFLHPHNEPVLSGVPSHLDPVLVFVHHRDLDVWALSGDDSAGGAAHVPRPQAGDPLDGGH